MKNLIVATAVMMIIAGLTPAASSQLALETIESGLQARNPEMRKEAVEALGLAGTKYRDRLEPMLHDKDVQIRLAAVGALAKSKNGEALHQALDDSAPEVRYAAAKALYTMNDPAGEKALFSVLSGGSKTSSNFIAEQRREAMHTLQTPDAFVKAALKGGTMAAPVPGLGEGVSIAYKVMSHRGTERAATALLLGKANDPEAIAALEHAATDKDARVRAAAIQALAMSDHADLAKDAEPLLIDKSRVVRLRAAGAYLRLSSIDPSDE